MVEDAGKSGAPSQSALSADGLEEKSPEQEAEAKDTNVVDTAAEPAAAPAGAGSSLASVVAGTRLSDAAAAIAKVVSKEAGNRTIVLVEERNVAVSDVILNDVSETLTALAGLLGRVDALVARVAHVPTPDRPSAAGEEIAVGAGETDGGEPEEELPTPLESLKQLSEIVGLFRSTFELTPQEIKADRTALMASVAGSISGKTVILPTMAWVSDAPLLSSFRNLLVRRHASGIAVARLEAELEGRTTGLASLRSRRATLDKKRDDAVIADKQADVDRFDRLIGETDAAIARIVNDQKFQRRRAILQAGQAMLAAFDERHAALAKAPAGVASPLIQAALREQVRKSAGGGEAAVLWVEIASTGGDRLTRKSPLGWNSEVSFIGAAQAIYLLVSTNGTLLAAGSETAFGHKSFDFHEFFDSTTRTKDDRWRRELGEYITIGSALVVGLIALAAILLVVDAVFS